MDTRSALQHLAELIANTYFDHFSSSSNEEYTFLLDSGNESQESFFLACQSVLGRRTEEMFLRAAFSSVDLSEFYLMMTETTDSLNDVHQYMEHTQELSHAMRALCACVKQHFPEQESMLLDCANRVQQNSRFLQKEYNLLQKIQT